MADDSDLFNRWQAANSFATRTLVEIAGILAQGQARASRATGFVKALGAAIAGDTLEPAYRAELLKLPSQADIARVIGRNVDPGADLPRPPPACEADRERRSAPCSRTFTRRWRPAGPFSPDAASAGRRALRNAALTLLAGARHRRRTPGGSPALLQGRQHDGQGACAVPARRPRRAPTARRRSADFYERWKGDHLVIDTWFAAQAQSPLARHPAQVKALTRHPFFRLTTPNKVRALIGIFAMQNPVQFHRPDGAGYEFVANQVLALDRFNPSDRRPACWVRFRIWQALETEPPRAARKALAAGRASTQTTVR